MKNILLIVIIFTFLTCNTTHKIIENKNCCKNDKI